MKGDEIAVSFGSGSLSAFLQVLLQLMLTPTMRYLVYMNDAHGTWRKARKLLHKMHTVLDIAEMQPVPDPLMLIWLRELKMVVYETEDALEQFTMEGDMAAVAQTGKWIFELIITKAQKGIADLGAAAKFDKIAEKLQEVSNEPWDLLKSHHAPGNRSIGLCLNQLRATSSLLAERNVIGREKETNEIIELLVPSSRPLQGSLAVNGGDGQIKEVPVLPIVAMGGLGKTTLAQLIYNHTKVQSHFKLEIWVCVSDNFNIKRITEEILESAFPNNHKYSEILNWNKLQMLLKSNLGSERFFLVLDDVWCEDRLEWDILMAPLRLGKEGSRILITTRSKKVAQLVGTMNPIFLEPLRKEHSRKLFEEVANLGSTSDVKPRVREICWNIADKLNGVPLALKTVGSLVHSNSDENVWVNVSNSEIWRLPQPEYGIMPALKASYNQLPGHLKLCFAFCSVFPKGFQINKRNLVQLWIAQQYVQPQGKKALEEIGADYCEDLCDRFFFMKANSVTTSSTDMIFMQDLMHDLAKYVSHEHIMITDDKVKILDPEKLIHCSLYVSEILESSPLLCCTRLRTLRYTMVGSDLQRLDLLLKLSSLRVLDLSASGITELPECINKLIHLKYLDLSRTLIKALPSQVGDLYYLQTMRLIACPITELPFTVNKLINLRTLDGKSELLSTMSRIRNMISLLELPEFKVQHQDGHKLEELKRMNELRGELHISGLENAQDGIEAREAMLSSKQYLNTLELEWDAVVAAARNGALQQEVLQQLEPHSNLKVLKIIGNNGMEFPSWLAGQHLCNLEEIILVGCRNWNSLPPFGGLSYLRVLEIRDMQGVKKLHDEFWGDKDFPYLEKLQISNLSNWDECQLSQGTLQLFPSLKLLEITDCPKLKAWPVLPLTLSEVTLSSVGLTALPPQPLSSSSSSSSKLSRLCILNCPNLTTLEELSQHQPSSLKMLDIIGCEKLESLTSQGSSALHSLDTLKVDNCPGLTSLPTTTNGGPSSSNAICNQPLLFQIYNLNSLTFLSISNCNNLEFLSGEGLKHLKALQTLSINGCSTLKTVGTQSLSCIINLVIKNCNELKHLTDNNDPFQRFIPVRSITIERCQELESLPLGMQCLASLEELWLDRCRKMNSLPDQPPSLKKIDIKGCPDLMKYHNGSTDLRSIVSNANVLVTIE
ncbi:putative disease resistance protein RGA3 [Dioscorea cayenensis subsp. rotundata]|uniref:Disease resistance protein RGA3 n=1 Tax=Dioscorea cayennensis subsp. rotundata TaxID=55577 RepID=A0AB40BRN3_DIOCR|nr:putative disease resistance protein RGA3 [Dioscorea cayenensis subsp. rotundata]